ncbi:hypothetical protein D3C83_25520 [compost metagenome]
MVQEGGDEDRIEIGHTHARGCFAEVLLHKLEQQPKGVAVGRDGVGTGPSLFLQSFGEKRLEHRREHGHRRAPGPCAARAAASSSNSGVAVRYQYVMEGFTWPRYVDSAAIRGEMSAPSRDHRSTVFSAKECRRS